MDSRGCPSVRDPATAPAPAAARGWRAPVGGSRRGVWSSAGHSPTDSPADRFRSGRAVFDSPAPWSARSRAARGRVPARGQSKPGNIGLTAGGSPKAAGLWPGPARRTTPAGWAAQRHRVAARPPPRAAVCAVRLTAGTRTPTALRTAVAKDAQLFRPPPFGFHRSSVSRWLNATARCAGPIPATA